MQCRNSADQQFSAGREMHLDTAPVGRAAALYYEPQSDTALDQGRGAVRTRLQAGREFADRGPIPPAETADMQQQEVLRLGDARGARRPLTEALKARELKAKVRQRGILLLSYHPGPLDCIDWESVYIML